MNLATMIEMFESLPKDEMLNVGLTNPHSWRGDYAELAFEPAEPMTAGELVDVLKSAIDQTYWGYKGGEYKMTLFTPVNIEEYGCWTGGDTESTWWHKFNSRESFQDQRIAELEAELAEKDKVVQVLAEWLYAADSDAWHGVDHITDMATDKARDQE